MRRMLHRDRLWADLGQSHFRPTGTLVVARDEGGWSAPHRSVPEAMALPVDYLDEPAAPPAVPPDRRRLLRPVPPTGGVLLAERILEGLRRWLMQRGARLHLEVPQPTSTPSAWRCAPSMAAPMRLMRWWSRRALDAAAPAGAARPHHAASGRAIPRAAPRPAGGLARGARGSRPVRGARRKFYAVPPVDGTRLKVGDHVFTLRGEPMRSARRARPTARRR